VPTLLRSPLEFIFHHFLKQSFQVFEALAESADLVSVFHAVSIAFHDQQFPVSVECGDGLAMQLSLGFDFVLQQRYLLVVDRLAF
jgi:hypothetical protein